MGFSEVLTKIMDERGISMYALAKMLDCSQSTVKYWLSGTTNPQRGTMKRLAEALDVPVEVLQGKEKAATDYRDGGLQRLLDDERALLESYRTMDESAKLAMQTIANQLRKGNRNDS